MAFEALTRYANPPSNVLGTSLFLSYIALALYFTSDVLFALYYESGKAHAPRSHNDRRKLKLLSALALVSFAALSFHMLKFLIGSFLTWNTSNIFFKPDENLSLFERIWHWMLGTNLFESFGKELVGAAPSTAWTQIALLGTWFWNVWIAERGTTYCISIAQSSGANFYLATAGKLSTDEMWAFVALSQILPISFTASLFLIRLQLAAPSSTARKIAKQQKKEKGASNSVKHANGASQPSKKTAFRISLPVSTIVLNALVLLLAPLSKTPYFIPGVILTRLILLLPHFGAVYVWSDDVWISSMLLSAGFVAANVNLVVAKSSQNWSRDLLNELWNGGGAVKALGWDAVIGSVIAVWMGLGEGV